MSASKGRSHSAQSVNTVTNITIANYLLNRLYELGVEHIFAIPGDYIIRFDKVIEEHPHIQFINATRENTAGYLANAYSQIRGIGVACITYGVGINIANATAQAFTESCPLIVISGAASAAEFTHCPHLHHLINTSHTERRDTTQLEIFRQITAAQAVLKDPANAASEIDRVLAICLAKQKPVYIELPRDCVDAIISEHTYTPKAPAKSEPAALQNINEEVKNLLDKAHRPVIWLGHEIQRFNLAPYVLKFAEKHRIPIAASIMGKTVISEHHPLYLGVYQGGMSREEVRDYVENSDCLLTLGVFVNDVETGLHSANLQNQSQINALSSKITIGTRQFKDIVFQDFIKSLETLKLKKRYTFDSPEKRTKEAFKADRNQKTTIKSLFSCLQKHIKSEHLIITDIGDCLFGSIDLILEKDSFISCAYFATLGFGTPGAVGAQLAAPDRRVIGIIGDGAFQMTCTELSTAVRYHLDPIIIVINNRGYGTERPIIEGSFNDIVNWNYSMLPEVFGDGVGIKTTNEMELENALAQAIVNRGRFYLIEVTIDPLDFSPAMKRFGKYINA